MPHAEIFIYPRNKIGMFEYPSIRWGDLVDGEELVRIKQIGLAAAEAGRRKTLCYVELVKHELGKRIPLCSAEVHIRVHDLRDYPPPEKEESIASWADISGEARERTKRWSSALTVDELYLMVDADLPRIAQIGRFLHGPKEGTATCAAT